MLLLKQNRQWCVGIFLTSNSPQIDQVSAITAQGRNDDSHQQWEMWQQTGKACRDSKTEVDNDVAQIIQLVSTCATALEGVARNNDIGRSRGVGGTDGPVDPPKAIQYGR